MWSLENHKVSAAEESTIVELRRAVQEAMATLHAKIALAEFYSDDDVLEALEALRQASRVAATEGVKGSHVVWHRERFLEKESELLKSMRESIQRLES